MKGTHSLPKGALLSGSAKILGKVIGFVSTLILARLLTPADFGLIAAVSVVLYLFDVLGNAATEQYIMQIQRLRANDLTTAWTINLLLKSMLALLLAVLSPWVAAILNKPEITLAIAVSALVLPLTALKSRSLLQLKRQIRYEGLFWLALVEKLAAFATVLIGALVLKSYWAFIFADLVSSVVAVAFSYLWFGKGPRFTLACWRQQLRFSSWMMGKNLIGYLRSQIDTVLVSRYFSASILGQYHLSRDLAMMPGHYILSPAVEPVLSSLRNSVDRRHDQFRQVSAILVLTFLLTLPLAFFFGSFGSEVARVVLGVQWKMAGPLLGILAWLLVYWGCVYVIELPLIASGRVRALFWFDALSLAVVSLTLYVALKYNAGINEFALYRVAAGVMTTILLIAYVYHRHLAFAIEVLGWGLVIGLSAFLSANLSEACLNLLEFSAQTEDLAETTIQLSVASVVYALSYLGLIILVFSLDKKTSTGAEIRGWAIQLVEHYGKQA
ncbi:Lipopolysaccharide biosynthesis protein WzxC [Thiorhodovibrio winogradskyi]|uniref:Lipopolysaccharide biosynthesis protein WzxC n=1 Tax=Thiorhodovibrio winogradskyi TaxID=77007 RepID=A0ABZ0S9G7_9GAMM|nr:oligosaccharide flippase family protein [Thiorhodovibrio winogradskyi]